MKGAPVNEHYNGQSGILGFYIWVLLTSVFGAQVQK
jgi:hypothetical protein